VKCEEHHIYSEVDDPMGCPVCYGEKKAERHTIKLLEKLKAKMEAVETGYGPKSGNMAIRVSTIEQAIAFIKGEQK